MADAATHRKDEHRLRVTSKRDLERSTRALSQFSRTRLGILTFFLTFSMIVSQGPPGSHIPFGKKVKTGSQVKSQGIKNSHTVTTQVKRVQQKSQLGVLTAKRPLWAMSVKILGDWTAKRPRWVASVTIRRALGIDYIRKVPDQRAPRTEGGARSEACAGGCPRLIR